MEALKFWRKCLW